MKNEKVKMTDDEYMEKYLSLDKNERVPFNLARHLFFSRKCRKQIKLLKKAEKLAAKPLKLQVPLTDSSIQAVIAKVFPQTEKKRVRRQVPFLAWFICGAIMLALFCAPTLLRDQMQSNRLSYFYSITFSAYIVGFGLAFIMDNIDFFIKRIATKIAVK